MLVWQVRQWFHCCFCHSKQTYFAWVLPFRTTFIMDPYHHDDRSKRRWLTSDLHAGSPTINRHVTVDHDSPVCHPSYGNPQNESDNEDNNSCSQLLFPNLSTSPVACQCSHTICSRRSYSLSTRHLPTPTIMHHRRRPNVVSSYWKSTSISTGSYQPYSLRRQHLPYPYQTQRRW